MWPPNIIPIKHNEQHQIDANWLEKKILFSDLGVGEQVEANYCK